MKFKLWSDIKGDTENEVWEKLLTLFTNACEWKRDNVNKDWPKLTSEGGFGGDIGTLKIILENESTFYDKLVLENQRLANLVREFTAAIACKNNALKDVLSHDESKNSDALITENYSVWIGETCFELCRNALANTPAKAGNLIELIEENSRLREALLYITNETPSWTRIHSKIRDALTLAPNKQVSSLDFAKDFESELNSLNSELMDISNEPHTCHLNELNSCKACSDWETRISEFQKEVLRLHFESQK